MARLSSMEGLGGAGGGWNAPELAADVDGTSGRVVAAKAAVVGGMAGAPELDVAMNADTRLIRRALLRR